MKKIIGVIVTSVIMLFACGPSTPGSEMLCGAAPSPTECPNPKCVCFLTQCGWKCDGWNATPDDQLTPDNGWSVSPDGIWTQNDAGVNQ